MAQMEVYFVQGISTTVMTEIPQKEV